MNDGKEKVGTLNDRPEVDGKAIAQKDETSSAQERSKQKLIGDNDMSVRTRIREFMQREVIDADARALLAEYGFANDEYTNYNAMIAKMYSLAKKGDKKAAKLLESVDGFTVVERHKGAAEERKKSEIDEQNRKMEPATKHG